MAAFHCERCDKPLSRKTARQIDGQIMCSTCMFSPKPANSNNGDVRVNDWREALEIGGKVAPFTTIQSEDGWTFTFGKPIFPR